MLEGKKNKYIQLIPFIIFFFFLLFLTKQTHYMGDDIKYMLRSSFNLKLPYEKISSLSQVFESTYYDYMSWNSRFTSTFMLLEILRFPLIIWRIINSLFITLSIYFGMRMIRNKEFEGYKDLLINIVVLWSFFGLNGMQLDECVFWITGSVFYSWALFYCIIVLTCFLISRKEDKWYHYLIYAFFAFMAGCSIEVLSISISVMLVFYLIFQKFIYKKYTKLHLSTSIIFWLTNIIQLIAPAIDARANIVPLSLKQRLFYGFVKFYNNQYIDTGMILVFFLMLLFINVRKHNKYLFYSGIIVSLPIIIIRLCLNTIPEAYSIIVSNPYGSYMIDGVNAFEIIPGEYNIKFVIIGYFLLLTIICALTIIEIYRKENDYHYLFILALSTITNIATWFSGIGTSRTSYFGQFFFLIAFGLLLYKNYEKINMPVKIGMIILMYYYLGPSATLYKYNCDIDAATIRKEVCNDIIQNGSKDGIVNLPRYKQSVHANFEDKDSWEYYYFGKYYLGLDNFTINFYDLD